MTRTVPPDRTPFADADLLVGTPGLSGRYLALALAVCADAVAFYQVVALLVDANPVLVWVLVAGFTGLALVLAHLTGELARRFTEHSTPAVGRPAAVLVGVWLLMGAVCFYVRATHTPVTGSGGLIHTSGDGAPQAHTDADLGSALLFLGLYLAGGLVAGVTAYLTRNPVADAYVRAQRLRAAARREIERLTPRHVRAQHRYDQEIAERERDRCRWELAAREREAWADELKHYARFMMAVHLADPAATDGLTDSGDRLTGGRRMPGLRSAPEEAA